jgi:uncharacterized protein YjbJ (UPF0337 family)
VFSARNPSGIPEARRLRTPVTGQTFPYARRSVTPTPQEAAMGTDDKMDNKADELVGKVKDRVGGATGDRDLQAEGQAQKSKGNLKQAGEKIKDAFKS